MATFDVELSVEVLFSNSDGKNQLVHGRIDVTPPQLTSAHSSHLHL